MVWKGRWIHHHAIALNCLSHLSPIRCTVVRHIDHDPKPARWLRHIKQLLIHVIGVVVVCCIKGRIIVVGDYGLNI